MGKLFKVLGVLLLLVAVVVVGGWLALWRPDISYAELKKRYADAGSRYLDLPGGVKVHYHDQGDPSRPTVVLVHGFSSSSVDWRPWANDLARDDWRVITLDLPGHGLTEAPKGWRADVNAYVDLVQAFADAKHLDHFVLAGHSMGGDVAWRYALKHPERLKGLVLVDSAGWPEPAGSDGPPPQLMKALATPSGRFLLRDLDNSNTIRRGLQRSFADPAKADDATIHRYVDFSRAPGHRDIIIDLLLAYPNRGFATREKLEAIRVPTLILQGEKDHLVQPDAALKFAGAIPGSTLVTYPNAGHMVPLEASDADLKGFLLMLDPRKPDPAAAKAAAAAKGPAVATRKPSQKELIFY